MKSDLSDYDIKEKLFSSENTRVYRAVRKHDQRPVVIRTCNSGESDIKSLQALQLYEKTLSKLDHPNIPSIVVFHDNFFDSMLVLDDIGGIDLQHFLKSYNNHSMPLELFLRIAIQVMDALSVIHHAHIIHKDLHPANIVINPKTNHVQIIDFGSASLLSREQPSIVVEGNFSGNLIYFSPEQTGRMNRGLDYRTDFYTAGITFYQMLIGKPPFYSDDPLKLMYEHIAVEHVSVAQLRPDVPAVISEIIDKLLQKDANARYQSALGVKNDFVACLQSLLSSGQINSFNLATQDISEHLCLDQGLFGRSKEVSILSDLLKESSLGNSKTITVTGQPGIGKSAIVNAFHDVVAELNATFVCGKFEQFQQHIPYLAIKQSLEQWLNQFLMMPIDSQARIKKKLVDSLEEDAWTLISFMPSLDSLLGTPEPLTLLSPAEILARFHNALKVFISIISNEHPIMLFIDDIQWADVGTLNLLPLLCSQPDSRLFVVLAYRETEAKENHDLQYLISTLENQLHDNFKHLSLNPLTYEDVLFYLASVFSCDSDEMVTLADIVYKKAGGNPFFTKELLREIYSQGLVKYSLINQRWTWNIPTIIDSKITDNVVTLMLERLRAFSEESQKLLFYGACIGSSFSSSLLPFLSGLSSAECERALWPAIEDGLLIQRYKDKEFLYHFAHDRILQAAYALFDNEKRKIFHWLIGLLLKDQYHENETSVSIFSVVSHLNTGTSNHLDKQIKVELANLNLIAAQRSLALGIWKEGVNYTKSGIALLENDCWDQLYKLTYELHLLCANCLALDGQLDRSKQQYEYLMSHTVDSFDKAKQCAKRIIDSIGVANYSEAVALGFQGLKFLNIKVPKELLHLKYRDTKEASISSQMNSHGVLSDVNRELDQFIRQHPLDKLHELPKVNDRKQEVAIELWLNLGVACSLSGHVLLTDYCSRKALTAAYKYGKTEVLPNVLAFYIRSLVILQSDINFEPLCNEVIRLLGDYPNNRYEASCYNILGILPIEFEGKDSLAIHYLKNAYVSGTKNGDIVRAEIADAAALLLIILKGTNNSELLLKCKHQQSRAKQSGVDVLFFDIAANYLRSMTTAEYCLEDHHFDTETLGKIRDSVFVECLQFFRIYFEFFNGSSSFELLKMVDELAQNSILTRHHSWTLDLYFLANVLLQKSIHINRNDPMASDQIVTSDVHRANFEYALKTCPNTGPCLKSFLEAWKLINANASIVEVAGKFKEATQLAENRGITHYAALAQEDYGRYLLEQGLDDLAKQPISKAFSLYQLWGCTPKEKQFAKEFDFLAYSTQLSGSISSVTSSSGSESMIFQTLDVRALMRSASAISVELSVDLLFEKIVNTIIESVGGTAAALVLKNGSDLLVEAYVNKVSNRNCYNGHIALADCDYLPHELIQNVAMNEKTINLGDALNAKESSTLDYVQINQCKSILSLPISYRHRLIGVFYIENNEIANSFSDIHLETIRVLLTQAAVSLENSRLFDEVKASNEMLEDKVAQRTSELDATLKDLQSTNKEISSFNSAVSHDLRAPIRAIKGMSKMLSSSMDEALEDESALMLDRITTSSEKMSELVDGLVALTDVKRLKLNFEQVNLSAIADNVVDDMKLSYPELTVNFNVEANCVVNADPRVMTSVMENLIGNAWKYSSKKDSPTVSFGKVKDHEIPHGVGDRPDVLPIDYGIFYVRDSGDGFDMSKAQSLFGNFKRLHSEKEFKGTGVGLATVKRIIQRHNGYLWAHAIKGEGATFYFSLPTSGSDD